MQFLATHGGRTGSAAGAATGTKGNKPPRGKTPGRPKLGIIGGIGKALGNAFGRGRAGFRSGLRAGGRAR